MAKIRTRKREYLNRFLEVIESKPDFHIWRIRELTIEFNRVFPKLYQLNCQQVTKLRKLCKYYRSFRHLTMDGDTSYIFVKSKRYGKNLKKANIECETVFCDIYNVIDTLRCFREIYEKEKNNIIFVNISSSNKICSIAGAIACMMWEMKGYYVEPMEYTYEKTKPLPKVM